MHRLGNFRNAGNHWIDAGGLPPAAFNWRRSGRRRRGTSPGAPNNDADERDHFVRKCRKRRVSGEHTGGLAAANRVPAHPGLFSTAFVVYPTSLQKRTTNEFAALPKPAKLTLQFVIGLKLGFRRYRIQIVAANTVLVERDGMQPLRFGDLNVVRLPFLVNPGISYSATLYGWNAVGTNQPIEEYRFTFSLL